MKNFSIESINYPRTFFVQFSLTLPVAYNNIFIVHITVPPVLFAVAYVPNHKNRFLFHIPTVNRTA